MSSYLNTHDFDIHKECWWLPTKIVKKRQGFYVDKQHNYGSSIKVAVKPGKTVLYKNHVKLYLSHTCEMTYATLKNKNNSRQIVLVTESTKTLILVDHNTMYKIN